MITAVTKSLRQQKQLETFVHRLRLYVLLPSHGGGGGGGWGVDRNKTTRLYFKLPGIDIRGQSELRSHMFCPFLNGCIGERNLAQTVLRIIVVIFSMKNVFGYKYVLGSNLRGRFSPSHEAQNIFMPANFDSIVLVVVVVVVVAAM